MSDIISLHTITYHPNQEETILEGLIKTLPLVIGQVGKPIYSISRHDAMLSLLLCVTIAQSTAMVVSPNDR